MTGSRPLARLALAMAVATLLAAGASAAAGATTVVIESAAPRPATVRVPPGELVVWRNLDATVRRVASDSRAWTPLVIAPGGRDEVRFRRPGRYRYRVDGARRGVVIVGARVRRLPPPGPGTRFHVYDVTATVRARYRERQPSDPDPRFVGSQDVLLTWTHRFPRVRLRVIAVGGLVQVGSDGFVRGTARPRLRFEESRTLFSGPCRGVAALPAYRARFLVGGSSASRGVRAEVSAGAQIGSLALATDLHDRVLAAQRRACPGTGTDPPVGPPVAPDFPRWLLGDLVTPEGVRVPEPGNPFSTLTTAFERRGGGRLPFPVDRLARGAGFTLDTGTRIALGLCGTGCSTESEGRVRWVFRPRPGR